MVEIDQLQDIFLWMSINGPAAGYIFMDEYKWTSGMIYFLWDGINGPAAGYIFVGWYKWTSGMIYFLWDGINGPAAGYIFMGNHNRPRAGMFSGSYTC